MWFFRFFKGNARDIIFALLILIAFAVLSCLIVKAGNKLEARQRQEDIGMSSLLERSISFCRKEFSEELAESVIAASRRHDVPVHVIYAIIATESGGGLYGMNEANIMAVEPKAESSAGCVGLMQLSSYAVDEYNRCNGTDYPFMRVYEIPLNIEIGTWYYAMCSSMTPDWIEAYMAYNVGPGAYRRHAPEYRSGRGPDGTRYNATKRFIVCLDICRGYFN